MPLMSMKCPNCAGEVQVDDYGTGGICLYCNSTVIFNPSDDQPEPKKADDVHTESEVETEHLKRLFQNAETFHKLGEFEKERVVLTNITYSYPKDYRAWWNLAMQSIEKDYERNENAYGELNEYQISRMIHNVVNTMLAPLQPVTNAIRLAPPEKQLQMRSRVSAWLKSYLSFFEGEKSKIIKKKEYDQISSKVRDKSDRAYLLSRITRGATAIMLLIIDAGQLIYHAQFHNPLNNWNLLLQLLIVPVVLFVIGGYRKGKGVKGWHDGVWYYEREWKRAPVKYGDYREFWDDSILDIPQRDENKDQAEYQTMMKVIDRYIEAFTKSAQKFENLV